MILIIVMMLVIDGDCDDDELSQLFYTIASQLVDPRFNPRMCERCNEEEEGDEDDNDDNSTWLETSMWWQAGTEKQLPLSWLVYIAEIQN